MKFPWRKKTTGEKFTTAVNKTAKKIKKSKGAVIVLMLFTLSSLLYFSPFLTFKVETPIKILGFGMSYDIFHILEEFLTPIGILAGSMLIVHMGLKDRHKIHILTHHIEGNIDTNGWGIFHKFFAIAPNTAKKEKTPSMMTNFIVNFLLENVYLSFSGTLVALSYYLDKEIIWPLLIAAPWFLINIVYDIFNQFEAIEKITADREVHVWHDFGWHFKCWWLTLPKRLWYIPNAFLFIGPWYLWFNYVNVETFIDIIVCVPLTIISYYSFFSCQNLEIAEMETNKKVYDEWRETQSKLEKTKN